jgi:adenylate cyclase
MRDFTSMILAASGAGGPAEVLGTVVRGLVAAGIPLWRVATSVHHFDPEILATSFIWQRDQGVIEQKIPTENLRAPDFPGSPVQRIVSSGDDVVRLRLAELPREAVHPHLHKLVDAGVRDYVIFALDLSEGIAEWLVRRSWISFASDGAMFTDDDLADLRAAMPILALRFSLEATKLTARTLLRAYLGHNAARRILDGAFRRGTGETIRAAIWSCDMVGFTCLGESQGAAELVRDLDEYFECVAARVDARGGEVLKLIGDAVLGVFALGDDGRAACRAALDAYGDVVRNLGELNARRTSEGKVPFACGVGLHVGDVMYGNIGARSRLDFTVIGSPVNEATRVEAATRRLDASLLFTREFRDAAGLADDEVQAFGEQALKGVEKARELYTLRR